MTEESVKKANITYHSILSKSYNRQQSHFRPENVERVDGLLRGFAKKAGDKTLLDIACGTGFILGISKRHFDCSVGIDNCEAMLNIAKETFTKDVSEDKIILHLSDALDIPFENGVFNVCSMYGSLHHFFELEPVLREVHRLLKDGGIFYGDQDPNYYFFRDIEALKNPKTDVFIASNYSNVVLREVSSVTEGIEKYEEEFGLDRETINLAEFQRFAKGGMKKETIERVLKKVGFSQVSVMYRWYLGEGYVYHQLSPKLAESIDEYLRMCLPLSKNLFKYLYIVAVK